MKSNALETAAMDIASSQMEITSAVRPEAALL